MSAFRWLFRNPIVERELRLRSRSRGFTIALSIELFILIGALTVVWVTQDNNTDVTELSSIGRTMAWTCVGVLQTIMFLGIPAIAGSSISGERERDTMSVLFVTPLKGSNIVTGKVIGTMLWVVFSIVASMPIFAICYAFGGIKMIWVILVLLYLLYSAFGISAVSVFASSHANTSSRGITLAYVYVVLSFVLGACVPFFGGIALLAVPFIAIALASARLDVRS